MLKRQRKRGCCLLPGCKQCKQIASVWEHLCNNGRVQFNAAFTCDPLPCSQPSPQRWSPLGHLRLAPAGVGQWCSEQRRQRRGRTVYNTGAALADSRLTRWITPTPLVASTRNQVTKGVWPSGPVPNDVLTGSYEYGPWAAAEADQWVTKFEWDGWIPIDEVTGLVRLAIVPVILARSGGWPSPRQRAPSLTARRHLTRQARNLGAALRLLLGAQTKHPAVGRGAFSRASFSWPGARSERCRKSAGRSRSRRSGRS